MDELTQQMILVLAQVFMQQTGEQDPNKAMNTIMQAMQAAQQGDQEAAQMLQQLAQIAQGGGQQSAPQMARKGAKLSYIKSLRGECPEGQEMSYYKVGGQMVKGCKKCAAKVETAQDGNKLKESGTSVVSEFKCGRKMKKHQNGGQTDKPGTYGTGIPGDPRKFTTKEQADNARKRTLATMKKEGVKNYKDLNPGD